MQYCIVKNKSGMYELIGIGHCGNGNDALYHSSPYVINCIEECFRRHTSFHGAPKVRKFWRNKQNIIEIEFE